MTQKTQRIMALVDKITISANYISASAGIALSVIILISVVARYFFNSPFAWVEEISCYVYLLHCFLAIAYTTYKESHVAAEILYVRFSPKAKYLVTIGGYILASVVSAIVVYYGFGSTWDYFVKDWASETPLGVTLWPIMLIVPLGFLIFGLQCFSRIYACHRRMLATGSVDEEKSLFGLDLDGE